MSTLDAFSKDPWLYYMRFCEKAHYAGPTDEKGVPLLDYRGKIGKQYNPIAVAQYALGCWNEYRSAGGAEWRTRFLTCADWLLNRLERNSGGCAVWQHHFDWEYFQRLRAPWYSGLAQGQGISVMVRAHQETGRAEYLRAAEQALETMLTPLDRGGTLFVDEHQNWWIEEYVTEPPTHILNGFLWALWGVYDMATLVPGGAMAGRARELWERGVATVLVNLSRYDCGYWSLYDLAPVGMRNPASGFYHRLHLVQLEVMHKLTGDIRFLQMRDVWAGYEASGSRRWRALFAKIIFKLRHY